MKRTAAKFLNAVQRYHVFAIPSSGDSMWIFCEGWGLLVRVLTNVPTNIKAVKIMPLDLASLNYIEIIDIGMT